MCILSIVSEGECSKSSAAKVIIYTYHLSSRKVDGAVPVDASAILIEAICADVKQRRDETHAYLRRVIPLALRRCHGALAVVLRERSLKPPVSLRDGLVLRQSVSIAEQVEDYAKHGDSDASSRLLTLQSLVEGIFSMDGVIAFRSDASIVGFNLFLSQSILRRGRGTVGGARRRAFTALASMVSGSTHRSVHSIAGWVFHSARSSYGTA